MTRPRVVGLILAGGLARRMGGGDKWQRALGGRPLLAHAIARAEGQVSDLAINANGDPARLEGFGLPVIPDSIEGFAGPLAGVLAGMDWACRDAPDCPFLATFACDAPFFPEDLVARLLQAVAARQVDLACAASLGRRHPVFGLWSVALREDLREALIGEGVRKVDVWTARHGLAVADFAPVETPQGPLDPFFNANRPEDLAEAERLLAP
jgi:molybdopterin-guanine dinucleotide biosynthesis protein A